MAGGQIETQTVSAHEPSEAPRRGRQDRESHSATTDAASGPNPHWLERAKLFETPRGRLYCRHGHDLEVVGVSIYERTHANGKVQIERRCKRCAVEQVQRAQLRKRQAARGVA